MLLIKEVENILEKGGFEYCRYDGCFDIAAQRDFRIFLKVLSNVDSFQATQAANLKIIANGFDAAVAVVGLHTRREQLKDNIIYERFDVPAFTPSTLESIVVNESFPMLYRSRGGLFVSVNPEKLRENREKACLSQSELAEKVGITKKSVYEHEHQNKRALLQTVERMEKEIGSVSDPIVLNFEYSDIKGVPRDAFEKQVTHDLKRMGFCSDSVYQTPFNIVAKSQKFVVLSKADESKRRLERDVPHVSSLSELTDVPALAITKDDIALSIPTVQEKDLRELRSTKDLRKLLK